MGFRGGGACKKIGFKGGASPKDIVCRGGGHPKEIPLSVVMTVSIIVQKF